MHSTNTLTTTQFHKDSRANNHNHTNTQPDAHSHTHKQRDNWTCKRVSTRTSNLIPEKKHIYARTHRCTTAHTQTNRNNNKIQNARIF